MSTIPETKPAAGAVTLPDADAAYAGAANDLTIIVSNDRELRDLSFWLLGSLGGVTWAKLLPAVPLLVLGLVTPPLFARALGALLPGERDAVHLGFDKERGKRAVPGSPNCWAAPVWRSGPPHPRPGGSPCILAAKGMADMRYHLIAVLLALVLAVSGTAGAVAQEQNLRVELNKLEAQGDGCRAYLLLQNHAGLAFSALKLDLVMFDADGIVARRLAVEAAPLPQGKTSLKVFDIAGLECGAIGRVLLNDVLACEGSGGSAPDCLSLLQVSGRGNVEFLK